MRLKSSDNLLAIRFSGSAFPFGNPSKTGVPEGFQSGAHGRTCGIKSLLHAQYRRICAEFNANRR